MSPQDIRRTAALLLVFTLWLPLQGAHAQDAVSHGTPACIGGNNNLSAPDAPGCGDGDLLSVSPCWFVCSGTAVILPAKLVVELSRTEQVSILIEVARFNWSVGPEPFPPKSITA